ncbi:MAG TPA: polysaccharide pyruvyl transferase family protein, partial [Amycolatopsis sp.]|nr:polysaccharide pyruvyl transferase family protein [Amycolatopsis sp.]
DARDEPSREMLGLDTLRVTADDVFLGLDASHYRWTDDAPDVMVCAQADIAPMFNGATDAATVAESVLRTLRSWDVPAEEVGFPECFPGVDSEVHDIVKKDLPGVRFSPLMDVLDHGLPVRAGQTWLSTRFHPHLMAASAGLGGIALSVRPDYYDVKHQSLIAQGSGWRLATLDEVPDRPRGGGFSSTVVEELRQRKLGVARDLYGF